MSPHRRSSPTCDDVRDALERAMGDHVDITSELHGAEETVYEEAPHEEAAHEELRDAATPSGPAPSSGAAGIPLERAELDRLSQHVATCATCREEIDALSRVEEILRRGFRKTRADIALPGEDRIAAMLREWEAPVTSGVLRRSRRTLKIALWIGFWAFCLGASCALVALAYRALLGDS